jgi:hypothetical protein
VVLLGGIVSLGKVRGSLGGTGSLARVPGVGGTGSLARIPGVAWWDWLASYCTGFIWWDWLAS